MGRHSCAPLGKYNTCLFSKQLLLAIASRNRHQSGAIASLNAHRVPAGRACAFRCHMLSTHLAQTCTQFFVHACALCLPKKALVFFACVSMCSTGVCRFAESAERARECSVRAWIGATCGLLAESGGCRVCLCLAAPSCGFRCPCSYPLPVVSALAAGRLCLRTHVPRTGPDSTRLWRGLAQPSPP